MAELKIKTPVGTYEIDLVTPPSGDGPRTRIDGTTYEIVSVATGHGDATPIRFYHPTEGTLAWSGDIILIEYPPLFSDTFTVSTAFTWEETDLSSYGVPGGCVAEIRIEYPGVYGDGDLEGIVGCRQVGSSLDRSISIQPGVDGRNSITLCVNVDADQKIEIYSNYLTGITTVPKSLFRVIGYYLYADYTETMITLQTTTDTWDDDDLYTDHGIPKGRVIEVLMGNQSNDYNRAIGLRSNGAVGRTYNISRGYYENGGHWVRVFETTNASNGKVDTYVGTDDSYPTHYCVGYWGPNVTYTLDGTTYAPTGTSAWEDVDVGLNEGDIANFVMYNIKTDGGRTVGVRDDGGATSRYLLLTRSRNASYIVPWTACAPVSSDNDVEMYSTNLTEGKLVLDGYLT